MKTDSKLEWNHYAFHILGCRECRRCQDTTDQKQLALLCGEGEELLAVARMHTQEELQQP